MSRRVLCRRQNLNNVGSWFHRKFWNAELVAMVNWFICGTEMFTAMKVDSCVLYIPCM
jgi:hypothetical protein